MTISLLNSFIAKINLVWLAKGECVCCACRNKIYEKLSKIEKIFKAIWFFKWCLCDIHNMLLVIVKYKALYDK